MPRPKHARVLVIHHQSVSGTIGMAYQDGGGHKEIWRIDLNEDIDHDKIYWAIVDRLPGRVITTHNGYVCIFEAIRAVCLTRHIPLTVHSSSRHWPFREHARAYLTAHRSFANSFIADEEVEALAGLFVHLNEVERDQLAKALR